MTAELLLQLLVALGGPFAVYGAIRADLARAVAVAEAAEKSADKAHDRLDGHLVNHS